MSIVDDRLTADEEMIEKGGRKMKDTVFHKGSERQDEWRS